jgi:16S rRNA processing protein RimM
VPRIRSRAQRVSPAAPEALPQQEADKFLAVARIVRPQGRRGEVVAEILTDFPQRFAELPRAYLENPGSQPQPVRVESVWRHKGRIVLKFSGVDSIDQANRLRGMHVLILREERMPLPAHQYYVWELEGCRVITARQGVTSEVGTVTDVEPTGGVDLLHVATPRGEVLIPLAQDICKRIDTAAKIIVIDPPEDLLELNQ